MRDVWILRCEGFAEEAEADAQFWAAMTPDERVLVVEQMRSEWWSINGRRDEGLRRVVHLAATHGVRAVIVGAHAVAFHAKPRYTKDLDWTGRARGSYGAIPVDFIGRAELIRNKRASGRPQDLADLNWLERPSD